MPWTDGEEGVVAGVGAQASGDEASGEGRGGARVSAAAAAGEDDSAGARPTNCCCVCLEPWTCYDEHRICCIPCGHVYGRSCLERLLDCCGNTSSKCPQCNARFEKKHIINLYAPGSLMDGCCRRQELEAERATHVDAVVASYRSEFMERHKMLEQVRSELDGKLITSNWGLNSPRCPAYVLKNIRPSMSFPEDMTLEQVRSELDGKHITSNWGLNSPRCPAYVLKNIRPSM